MGPSPQERLVQIVQELSRARTVDAIAAIVRTAARELAGADGASFVLRDNGFCYYADEDAIAPLWKGKRFPMETCVSGWVMNNRQAAVIPDIYDDPRVPTEAYRPTFVKSMAMAPIRRDDPIAAIGVYWSAKRTISDDEITLLQALADTTSVAMENADLYGKLQNKIESLEIFTRSLAHDLKEPVRTIRAFSSMITASGKESDYLRFVRDAGDRMSMLIDSVFNFTQLDGTVAIDVEPFPLSEAVEAARANLAQLIAEHSASIIAVDLPMVRANRAHMEQLFQNLIANAVAHNSSPVTVYIAAREEDRAHVITVRDNGKGVPEDQQVSIFKPFRRLSHADGHAGLGLAICQKIAALHGGEIACTSAPSGGAVFTLTLPATSILTAGTPAPSAQSEPAVPEPKLARILIVDDREPDLHLTQAFLSAPVGAHCEFLFAMDGQAALTLLNDKSTPPIDLILLDINMPIMNGFETLEHLSANPKLAAIPVVMCSGSSYQRDKDRASALGAIGYMEKPARFDKLRPILKAVRTIQVIDAEEGAAPTLMRAA